MENRRTCQKDLLVNRPVKDGFWGALDYWTYPLADKSSRYNEEVARIVAKCANRLQVQMKSQTFNLFDPSLLSDICQLSNCLAI